MLYTDLPTESFSEVVVVVMDYATRFLIEEFHKGLKTGMKVEKLQLERANRLFAAIAVMSVVALRLLDLRELGRDYPDAPATCTGLDELELQMLSLATERDLTTVAERAARPGTARRPHEPPPRWDAGLDHAVARHEGAPAPRERG